MNKKDQKRRDFILNENLWYVVFSITLPIAIYNGFNYIYGLIDTILVAKISSTAVSSVAYLDQIKNAISTLGSGLAAGGSIIVARYLGANQDEKAKKNANTLTFMAIVMSLIIITITVPLAIPILKLAKTPDDLIAVGASYFIVQMITIALVFFNSVFIGLQKAKGSTKSILFFNVLIMSTKLSLSLFFIFVMRTDKVELLALSTLIGQSFLTIVGLFYMFNKSYLFHLSIKDINLKKSIVLPIIIISFPIFLGKLIFSLGKVVVNSISTDFGSQVVGSLGVSNQIAGSVTGIASSFEESGSTIISQNIGNKNIKRALKAFNVTTVFSLIVSITGFILLSIFMKPIASLYDKQEASYYTTLIDSATKDEINIKMTFNYDEILIDFSYTFNGNQSNLNLQHLNSDNFINHNLESIKSDFSSYTALNSQQQLVIDAINQTLDKVLIEHTFSGLIIKVFEFERWGILFLSFSYAVLALLYGFGYTRLTMILNLARLFIFRIPSLLIIRALITLPDNPDQRVAAGANAVGISMMVSNTGIGIMSLVVALFIVYHIIKKGFKDPILIE